MSIPAIISFYTPNYKYEARRLIKSLDKFGLKHHVSEMEPSKHWIDNVMKRAMFIFDAYCVFRRPLIWLDADAEVLRYPELFETFSGDFGACFFDWPTGQREVLGGTMYFGYSLHTLGLLDEWTRLNRSMPKPPRSQLVLNAALKSFRGTIVELPKEYTYIPRFMPEVADPVILHHQASGKYRRPDQEGFDIEDVTGPPITDPF